jgi:hypothetical protein
VIVSDISIGFHGWVSKVGHHHQPVMDMAPTNAFHVKFFQFLPPGCPPPPDTVEECMRRPDTLGDPVRHKCLVVLILPTHKAEAGNLRNFLQIKLAILLLFGPWCCCGKGGQILGANPGRQLITRESRGGRAGLEELGDLLTSMGPPQGKTYQLRPFAPGSGINDPFLGACPVPV